MEFGMIGPCIVLCMGCVGSAIGCGIAVMASHGVMHYVKDGVTKFVAISFLPATQAIYGMIMMTILKGKVLDGSISALTSLGIGTFVGLALLMSAFFQGKSTASAIEAIAKNSDVFGKAVLGPGALEVFALFAWVFAILLF